MAEKTPIYKNEYENQGKNSPFGRTPTHLSTKWRPTVFPCPKTPKNKPGLP